MQVNEIKKGAELRLSMGRRAKMADNARGIIRMVEVEGDGVWFNEIGSVYASDIEAVKVNGRWELVELSDAQRKKLQKIGAAL